MAHSSSPLLRSRSHIWSSSKLLLFLFPYVEMVVFTTITIFFLAWISPPSTTVASSVRVPPFKPDPPTLLSCPAVVSIPAHHEFQVVSYSRKCHQLLCHSNQYQQYKRSAPLNATSTLTTSKLFSPLPEVSHQPTSTPSLDPTTSTIMTISTSLMTFTDALEHYDTSFPGDATFYGIAPHPTLPLDGVTQLDSYHRQLSSVTATSTRAVNKPLSSPISFPEMHLPTSTLALSLSLDVHPNPYPYFGFSLLNSFFGFRLSSLGVIAV